jgi:sugar lactone lactonase YvrE
MHAKSVLVAGFAAICLICPLAAQPVVTLDPTEVPVGIALDKTGNAWVSLQPQCELRRYTPDWKQSLSVKLVSPCNSGAGTNGVAVDSTGVAYTTVILRPDVRGVYAVYPSGFFYRFPGSENMVYPNSVAFDHNKGTIYATDMMLGQVWRIRPGAAAELWIDDPSLKGIQIPGTPLLGGANGIAVDKGSVVVSVSYLPRLVKIPIQANGSAGTPEILADYLSFFAGGIFALDDIALDVFGNVFASVVAGPYAVARFSPADKAITTLGSFSAAVLSLAFGTGKGDRQSLFVATSGAWGGTGSVIVRLDVGVPGRPIP